MAILFLLNMPNYSIYNSPALPISLLQSNLIRSTILLQTTRTLNQDDKICRNARRLKFSFPKNSATFSAEVLVFGVVRLRTSTSPAPTRPRFFRLPPPPPLKIQTCKLGEQRPEEEHNEPCYNQKLPEAQSHEERRHGRTNRGENQRLLFTKSANPGIVVRSIPQKSTFRITSSAEGFVLK